tara:strand:+ start:693 stop:1139 length:447 start_codon:yes stop_codon:yes gene_type:complete
MKLAEAQLRSFIKHVLIESEMEELKVKKAFMMSLFKDDFDIANVLNTACSKVRPRKLDNIRYYIDDEEIIEKAMLDKRMRTLYDYRDIYGSKRSLGKTDRNKIKGALRSILSHCKDYKKLSCTIEAEDVKKITSQFIDYDHIGMTGPK